MNADVEKYIENARNWSSEMRELRNLLLECGLEETYKWKQPCYTFRDKNVLIIGQFKAYCTLSFFKGSLMADPEKLMVSPGPNSQSVRMLRFTDSETIHEKRALIKSYVFEAIELEKSGAKVEKKETKSLDIPDELQEKMDNDTVFAEAFNGLTPGRQRGYVLYFNGAKQAQTRKDRIERYTDRILKGKGFHDCVCGLSRKMPTCDGSHKQLENAQRIS